MSKQNKCPNRLWNYFTKLPEEGRFAICKQCSKKLSYRTSISNLKAHLRGKHYGYYNAYLKELKTGSNTSVQKTTTPTVLTNRTVYLLPLASSSAQPIKYEIASPENQETDQNIEDITEHVIETKGGGTLSDEEQKYIDAMFLKMIVKTYQPTSIVEEQDFKEFVGALNADYVLPKSKDLTEKVLPDIYNKCLDEQNAMLQQEAVTICLTIDRWTSIKMITFIAITAHFISPDFQFKSVLLKCCQVKSGTSEDLASIIRQTCMEWDIFTKILWCVTDDGAEIVQAVNLLGWNHYGCIAYKLNLTIQNSLKSSDRILTKVNKIVNYFQSNCQAKEMLLEYHTKIQDSAQPLMLLDSVATSWISIYYMIERFMTLQESIKTMITHIDDDLPLMTSADWSKLKQLCRVLKPFIEATKELGADKYACASKAIAVVNGLKDVLQELKKKPDYYCYVTDEVECIEAQLNEQFHGIESEANLALCTILDPRYKMSMFLDENAAEKAKLNLVTEVHKLMKDSKGPVDPLKMCESSTVEDEDEGEFSLWRRRTMILERRLVNPSVNHQKLAQQEVESYLQDDLADGDPCQWWQINQFKFPYLLKLFKTRCNMVATSVPSEQLFSKAGSTLCERRKRLSVKKAEHIVFLNANLKDGDYINFMP